jgi:undecaprenyl diphosphate synthase
MFKSKKGAVERLVPKHIGIIMDGNGRWAKKRMLPRTAGHVAGSENFKTIARYCNKIGVKFLTVYAFSTENWKRPKEEVDAIMDLLRKYLKELTPMIERHFPVDYLLLPNDLAEFYDVVGYSIIAEKILNRKQ